MFLNTLCLYLGNLLWQVCITSLVSWRETSVSLRLWEHNTWFLLHHISLIITLSVRTNQHRHKMLDILPSRPLDVRTQLASSPSPLIVILITSWRRFARNCRLHHVLSPLYYGCCLHSSHVPHGSGTRQTRAEHSYILPQHLLGGNSQKMIVQ